MSSGGRRRPANTDRMVSLKVDNLTFRTTPESLKRVFERYGDVGDVYIPRDPYTQESRGFAFVRYYDQRDADDAIDAIDGTVLDGREIGVKMARHPRPIQSYYRGAGRGGGGGGGGRSSSRNQHRRRSFTRSRSRSHSRRRSSTESRSRSRSRNERNRNHSDEKGIHSEKTKSNSREDQSKKREKSRSPEKRSGNRNGRRHSRRSSSQE